MNKEIREKLINLLIGLQDLDVEDDKLWVDYITMLDDNDLVKMVVEYTELYKNE